MKAKYFLVCTLVLVYFLFCHFRRNSFANTVSLPQAGGTIASLADAGFDVKDYIKVNTCLSGYGADADGDETTSSWYLLSKGLMKAKIAGNSCIGIDAPNGYMPEHYSFAGINSDKPDYENNWCFFSGYPDNTHWIRNCADQNGAYDFAVATKPRLEQLLAGVQAGIVYDLPDDMGEMSNDSSRGSPPNFSSELFQKKSVVKIWTRANSEDRVKLATSRSDFTTGRYIWNIYMPPLGVGDQSSIGAFIYMDDQHELDFECGYGPPEVRSQIHAGSNDLVCFMTSQDYPYSTSAVAVPDSNWYTLELQLVEMEDKYMVKWYINGQDEKSLSLHYGPDYSNSDGDKFGMRISVENLDFIGEHSPTLSNGAYFNYLAYLPTQENIPIIRRTSVTSEPAENGLTTAPLKPY